MEALDLMKKLIDNPEERAKYKQNPAAYLSSLDAETRKHVRDVMSLGVNLQVGTVSRLRASANPDYSDGPESCEEIENDPNVICLEGEDVRLLTLQHDFFIEVGVTGDGVFLQHSYANIKSDVKEFILNLGYTNPEDKYDRQQVLNITTLPRPEDPESYNCANMKVVIKTDEFVLLLEDEAFDTKLDKGSHYNKATNTLYLTFHDKR